MSTSAPLHSVHPFDTAIALQPVAEHRFAGRTTADFGNMVGPFGGITAAVMLQAVCQHLALLGEPVAMTVNFAGPVADGPFELHAQPLRTNRSTQHWRVDLIQGGAVATTATAVTALRRQTWSATDLHCPDVPPPADVPVQRMTRRVAWFQQYEMRFIEGAMPDFRPPKSGQNELTQDTTATAAVTAAVTAANPSSTSTLWMRDEPPRTLDFPALAALCDVFIPRIFLRRQRPTPAGTVSITTYFHADAAMLVAQGVQPVLGQARGQNFRNGFFDQTAEVWGSGGALLATSHQIVYYKE